MKHTKGEIKIGYNKGKIQIYSDNNGIAEHIYELPDQSEKSEVNAERIVRCWNMHDELLEACIHALEMCNEIVMPTENDLTIMAGRLKAAIKKATQ